MATTPRILCFFALSAHALLFVGSAAHAACVVPSYNEFRGVPPGHTADQGFVGQFDFPLASQEPLPAFLSIDFTTDWRGYLDAALDYSLAGNVAVDFDVRRNAVRRWYHALWMHPGNSGREFLRGMTKERATDPNQLAPGLTRSFDTWAIGFYNELGATTFAKVWTDPCAPALDDVLFPIGTVSFKLLFTTATAIDLPYVSGAPEWMADIGPSGDRVRSLRLYQIDLAIRDPRAARTGWVFGTYVYQADAAGQSAWDRLVPVGLSWGNDRFRTPGETLGENRLNQALDGKIFGWPGREEIGWGGRVNGPADNKVSSCMSCHGSAQYPRSDELGNVPRNEAGPGEYQRRLAEYFRDIFAGNAFDAEAKLFPTQTLVLARPLDYSLQLQTGVERMCAAAIRGDPPFDTAPFPAICPAPPSTPPSTLAAPASVSSREQLIEELLAPIR